MRLVKVLREEFLAIEDAFADTILDWIMESAEPTGNVEMLRGFVTFPIGFTAKGLGTLWECAAVGTFVTFLMFSTARYSC